MVRLKKIDEMQELRDILLKFDSSKPWFLTLSSNANFTLTSTPK